MADYYYPLPPKKLKTRYTPLFEIIRKRQSGSFIGLPESAKSGYLQFLLLEKNIIRSLLPEYEKKYKILYFEPIPLITDNFYHWLFQLSIKLEILDSTYLHVKTENPVIILTNIQKYLLELSRQKKHLTIIISSPSIWSNFPEVIGYVFKALWDVERQPPDNPCSLIFLLHSKNPALASFPQFYNRLRIIMSENVLHFPVLDFYETAYTVDRFAYFANLNLPKSLQKVVYDCTGGYYPLITNIVKVCKALQGKITSKFIKSLVNNQVITKEIGNLWNSLSEKQKTELKMAARKIKNDTDHPTMLQKLGIISKNNKIISKWIKTFIIKRKYLEYNNETSKSPKFYLKGREYLVYKNLYLKQGELVTRDEIAEVLWKDKVKERYSDWAIDKTISRIRKKLLKHNAVCSIITLKKQGYVLLS